MLGINTYASTDKNEDVSVIPQMRVSAVDCLTQGFNFVVTLNEFTFGFQSVSGLSISKDVEYISEGGVNDHTIMVSKPTGQEHRLNFKRGMVVRSPTIVSREARAAAAMIPNNMGRKAALLAVSSLDPQDALENGPAVGTIKVYSRERSLRALYSFLSLGMVNWSVDGLDAMSTGVLLEEIEIVHTGLVRHPVTIVPPIVKAATNFVSDIKTTSNAKLITTKIKETKESREAIEELKKKEIEKRNLEKQKQEEEKSLSDEENKLSSLERELREAEENN